MQSWLVLRPCDLDFKPCEVTVYRLGLAEFLQTLNHESARTVGQHHKVVEKVKDFGSRLKKSNADGGALQMRHVTEGLDHLKSGAAVQASADFVHHHD